MGGGRRGRRGATVGRWGRITELGGEKGIKSENWNGAKEGGKIGGKEEQSYNHTVCIICVLNYTWNPYLHCCTHLILRWIGGVVVWGRVYLGLGRGFGQSEGRGRFRVLPKLWVKLIDFTDCDIALQGIMWRNGGERERGRGGEA